MLHVAIVDDDLNIREEINNYIKREFQNKLVSHTFPSYAELDEARDETEFDIYLLDIEVGEQNGVDYGVSIRYTNQEAVIIFITSFDHYALDGYDARPMAYLVKPVEIGKLGKLLNEAVDKLIIKPKLIEISENNNKHLLKIKDIISMERDGRKTNIKTRNDYFEVYESLKILISKTDEYLIRVNQSVYINPLYLEDVIKRKEKKGVRLINGEEYFFSRDGYRRFLKDSARWRVENE